MQKRTWFICKGGRYLKKLTGNRALYGSKPAAMTFCSKWGAEEFIRKLPEKSELAILREQA
jgi:hypothetical protein